jgi:Golgi nucleoside diphosphatase
VNATVSDDILSSVRNVLAKSGFQFTKNNTRIITGEEEGSSGWITVNYLKKILQEKHTVTFCHVSLFEDSHKCFNVFPC